MRSWGKVNFTRCRAMDAPLRFQTAVAERLLEGADGRLDVDRLGKAVGDGLLGLEAGAGDEGHHELVRVDVAGLYEAPQPGDDDAARRLGEDAFALRQEADALHDLLVADSGAGAARIGHRAESVIAIGRVANRQGLGDCVW